jgi:hypothetical protein
MPVLESRRCRHLRALSKVAFSQGFQHISGHGMRQIDDWRKINKIKKNSSEIFDTPRSANYRSVR